MTNPPIICINLLRAVERKKDILDRWTHQFNLPIEFIEAFDRRNIDSLHLNNTKISDGEAACSMSHILAYRHMTQHNYSDAIIIEDDAIPLFKDATSLYLAINSANQEFPNIHVLLLHSPSTWKKKYKNILQRKQYSSLISGNPYGTFGYYIKNTAIESMTNNLLSFNMPADHHWYTLGEIQKLAIINSPLIGHPPVNNATTYIDRPRDKRRKFIE